MKLFIIIGCLLCASGTFGQSQSQRWEQARYELNVNQASIYNFEIKAENHDFSGLNFEMLKDDYYAKEGIIDLKLNGTTSVIVYAYEMIDIDVIKSIFITYDPDITVFNRKRMNLEELENSSLD